MGNATINGKKVKKAGAIGTNKIVTPHGDLEIRGGGEQKRLWNFLDGRNEDHQKMIAEAIDSKFIDYVDGQAASEHVAKFLGFIDPRVVINLSRNLTRKLTLSEVQLLGGYDGRIDSVETCEVSGVQFKPKWGLNFQHNGVLVHVLNQMNAGRPLDEALCMTKWKEVTLLGNKMHIVAEESGETMTMVVNGYPWGYNRNGEIWRYTHAMTTVHKGLVERENSGHKARWWVSSINISVDNILAPARERIVEQRKGRIERQVAVVGSKLDQLFLKG